MMGSTNMRTVLFAAVFLLIGSLASSEHLKRMRYNNPGLVVDLGVGLWPVPVPMDYDEDGDNDLIVVVTQDVPDGYIYFFENPEGKVQMPVFKPGIRLAKKYKQIFSTYVNGKPRLMSPAAKLVDFKKLNFQKTVKVYPSERIHSSEGRIRGNQWGYCDYDGDGDQDLVVGIGDWTDYGWDDAFDEEGRWLRGPLHGYVYLIQNDGGEKNPRYAEPVKVEAGQRPVDVYGFPSPNFADFDGDGDLDLLCGEFVDRMTYFQNVGTRSQPKYSLGRFLTHQGETISMDECMITPVAYDWDNDRDIDLIVGQVDGRIAFVENTGTIADGMPQFLPPRFFQQTADHVMFGALNMPCSFDWDGDGDEDLICGNSSGYIGFFENLDGGNPPKWAKVRYLQAEGEVIRIQAGYNGSIQGPCERKWGYTTLSVADWDHDGLPDIVANSIWGKVLWYRNVGTRQKPKLLSARPIEVEWPSKAPKPSCNWWDPEGKELVTQWRTSPVVMDLNEDGLRDSVMLDYEGYLALFERTRANTALKLLPGKRVFKSESTSWFDHSHRPQNDTGGLLRLNSNHAGRSGRRKFCFADWNLDGKTDLLVNSRNISFLRNVSDKSNEYVFQEQGMVDELVLAGYTTSPTVVDWDQNHIPDLLVGAEDGFLYYVRNPHADIQ